jgi:hypothetical protein
MRGDVNLQQLPKTASTLDPISERNSSQIHNPIKLVGLSFGSRAWKEAKAYIMTPDARVANVIAHTCTYAPRNTTR